MIDRNDILGGYAQVFEDEKSNNDTEKPLVICGPTLYQRDHGGAPLVTIVTLISDFLFYFRRSSLWSKGIIVGTAQVNINNINSRIYTL